MDTDPRQRCIACLAIVLVSIFAGCFGDGPEPTIIKRNGVVIYHPSLINWLSDDFIKENNITPHPHLAIFIPGPEETNQRILRVYHNFNNPWIVNGTFMMERLPDDSHQFDNWAFARTIDLDVESITNVSEFDNVVVTIPSVSAIIDNHTVGTSTDRSFPFISFDEFPSFWNDVWIKGVAFDTETVLNWSVFRPELVTDWEEFSSSFLPFEVGGLPDHLVLGETVRLAGPEMIVRGDVLAHVTPFNHLDESLKILNTPIDTEGTRFIIDLVARTEEQLVVLEEETGMGSPSDVWWVLMPFEVGSVRFTGTVSLNVIEANMTMISEDLGLAFVWSLESIPHICIANDDVL